MGAHVIAVSRSIEPLQKLKAERPNITVSPVNLGDWNETKTALAALLRGKSIDGLVNNAGVAICKPLGEFTEQDFDE